MGMIKPDTVDGVMSVFTKTISKLQAVADREDAKANTLRQQRADVEAAMIAKLTTIETKTDVAASEATRARKMGEKLAALIEE